MPAAHTEEVPDVFGRLTNDGLGNATELVVQGEMCIIYCSWMSVWPVWARQTIRKL